MLCQSIITSAAIRVMRYASTKLLACTESRKPHNPYTKARTTYRPHIPIAIRRFWGNISKTRSHIWQEVQPGVINCPYNLRGLARDPWCHAKSRSPSVTGCFWSIYGSTTYTQMMGMFHCCQFWLSLALELTLGHVAQLLITYRLLSYGHLKRKI